MKKLSILFTILIVISASVQAQVPQSFNYQAVVRDVSGGLLANAPVTVQVKIIRNGSVTDFCETHNTTTNDKGLINLAIGTGTLCTPSTPLSDINWSVGTYSMEVKTTAGGQTVEGESPLRSVPFALEAASVEYLSYDPATGFIGIGTPTPTAPLTVVNSNKAIIEFQRDAAKGAIEQNNAGGALRLESIDGDAMIQLRTYGDSYFNGGKVGIGTSSPVNGLLDVNGTASVGKPGDGNVLLNLNSERNWQFRQSGSGASSRLELANIGGGGNKDFMLNTSGLIFLGNTTPGTAQRVNIYGQDNNGSFAALTINRDGKKMLLDENEIDAIGSPLFLNHNTSSNVYLATGGGSVGIGTTDPSKAKLVVNGSISTNPASTIGVYHSFSYYALNNYVDPNETGNRSLSIYASNDIAAKSLHVFSDARIKTIDGVSDSQLDLETLKQIQITDYHYKDFIANGTAPQKKVIAQQVAEVYPQAVSKNNTEIIPDIMKNATADADWISLENHPLKKGDRVRLIVGTGQKELDVLEVEADKFRVSEPVEGSVFVYGKEVHDFHTVDYEAIAMLNVSATQELVKIIEQQRAEIAGLKSANSQVKARLEALEAAIGTANATADANQE